MRRTRLLAWLLVCAAAAPARANPLDIFGLGGRGPALANAMVALADDASAAYYNPAGLARAARPSFFAGYSFGVPRLSFDGRDAAGETSRGLSLGLVVPREVGGTTLAFGIALYFPDQRLVRIQALPATEARFIQYDTRMNRIAIHPALAWRPAPWIAIGAGVSILADARGAGTSFDLGLDITHLSDPSAQRATARIDVNLPTRVAPVAGIWLEPHPRLRFGVTYRGAISLDVAIDTKAQVDAGVLQGSALTGLSASDAYSPPEVVFGVAADLLPRLTLTAEAIWAAWSQAPSPLPTVRALLNLGIPVDVVQVSIPSAAYQPSDTVSARLGLEGRFSPGKSVDVEVRGGASWEPTPYPRQTGATSLADNDRLLLTAGVGVVLRDLGEVLRGPLRFDLYLQTHLLKERMHPKDDPLGPTPSFRSGGSLFAMGLMMGMGF